MESSVKTINDVFYTVIERNAPRVLMYKQRVKWIPLSARELYRNVVGTARALESWGVGPGDRVALLSENRPEWAIADFATMLLGAADVPIYPTLTPEQTAYMLNDSGAKVVFVSTHDQMRKVLAIKSQTKIEHVVIMDYIGTPEAIPMHRLMHAGPIDRDREFDRRAKAVDPDAMATIIYTSGTTGTPKGAILTQGNLASNLFHSLDFYQFTARDLSLSFLPLSHITARHLDYAMYWHGVVVAYCPFIDELMLSLLEVKPTVFVAVPRVYEKIYNNVQQKIGPAGMKRKLYNWALSVGRVHRDEVYAGQTPRDPEWRLANRLLFSKIRKGLGGRVEVFISGGAPLNPDLQDWYASVGLRIFEGYGLTETSPVIALNNPKAYRARSVGKPLANLEVKIAEDGELWVKGPSIFKGYWNMPVETAEAFEDGWFKTGDIANIDSDGFLYITDRKKDLIKTSGGKFVAPQPIEASLKTSDFVAEAAMIGDKRKFAVVIIAPNFATLEDWARQNGVQYSDREELVNHPRVQALYREVVAGTNARLAQFEKIKKILLVADEFTVANGALTPTLKLRRRVIESRYRNRIEDLYSSASTTSEVVSAT